MKSGNQWLYFPALIHSSTTVIWNKLSQAHVFRARQRLSCTNDKVISEPLRCSILWCWWFSCSAGDLLSSRLSLLLVYAGRPESQRKQKPVPWRFGCQESINRLVHVVLCDSYKNIPLILSGSAVTDSTGFYYPPYLLTNDNVSYSLRLCTHDISLLHLACPENI